MNYREAYREIAADAAPGKGRDEIERAVAAVAPLSDTSPGDPTTDAARILVGLVAAEGSERMDASHPSLRRRLAFLALQILEPKDGG